MPIIINTDRLYDTDLTDAAWTWSRRCCRQLDPAADRAQPTFALC